MTDPDAVLAAGRAAYLRVWPDDDEAAASADVGGLGRALYQLVHAGGLDALSEPVPGLLPLTATTQVHAVQEQSPLPSADTWEPDRDDRSDDFVVPPDAEGLFSWTAL